MGIVKKSFVSEKFHTNVEEATVKGGIIKIGNNWNQSFKSIKQCYVTSRSGLSRCFTHTVKTQVVLRSLRILVNL